MRETLGTLTLALLLAPPPPAPRLRHASLPALPDVNVGAGEVLLEAEVDAAGRVTGTRVLRDAPPYTEPLRVAVGNWGFEVSRDAAGRGLPSLLLVGASYRPATVVGPALGEAPRDVAAPSGGIVFPVSTTAPLYPPLARGDGQVLVEVDVAPDGTPTARVFRSGPGFDDAALQAARAWRFKPTPSGGRAYLLFGFRGTPG